MNDIALVPLKNLSEAKRRLANHLRPQERKALVLAMLDDVLTALNASKQFSQIHVITPDRSVEKRTALHRVGFIKQKGAGLNSAVRQGLRELKHSRKAPVTIVLADLPLAEPSDFRKLVEISKETPRVVLAPSMKGGTNVMLRTPPAFINTYYGRWSYAKHLRAAQQKHAAVYSISNPRLSFDVDDVHDLRMLVKQDRQHKTNASQSAKGFSIFSHH